MIIGFDPGNTSLVRIWSLLAPNDCINFIFRGSVAQKPLYSVTILTIKFINKAMTMIDLVLAPTQMISSGPKATFGNEFNRVRNGSITLARNLKEYRRIAIINPKPIPKEKAIIVSYIVVIIWGNRLFWIIKLLIVAMIRLGLEKINGLIILYLLH